MTTLDDLPALKQKLAETFRQMEQAEKITHPVRAKQARAAAELARNTVIAALNARFPDWAKKIAPDQAMPRAECPRCKQQVPVRLDGAFRQHKRAPGRTAKWCRGTKPAALALLACVLLSGCGSEQPSVEKAPGKPAFVDAFDVNNLGDTAEMRGWRMGDGTQFVVIGRAASFVVFVKDPSAPTFVQRFTNVTAPPNFSVKVERP